MPKFGRTSRKRLETCHPDLITLFEAVAEEVDCSVICGHRNKEDQDKAVASGHSKAVFPKGKHNASPSNAIDIAPYPIDWNDRERFIYFGGVVKGFAYKLGLPLRWGGDWDNDTQLSDNSFDDLVHFEVRKD